MRRRRGLALPLILLAIPGTALAWTAANGSAVIPVSADRFEVINRASSRAPDYWCGAGDYAIAGLRTAATQRVLARGPCLSCRSSISRGQSISTRPRS